MGEKIGISSVKSCASLAIHHILEFAFACTTRDESHVSRFPSLELCLFVFFFFFFFFFFLILIFRLCLFVVFKFVYFSHYVFI